MSDIIDDPWDNVDDIDDTIGDIADIMDVAKDRHHCRTM